MFLAGFKPRIVELDFISDSVVPGGNIMLEDTYRSLLEEHQELKSILKNSHDGIYVTDSEGNTIWYNPATERNFHVTSQELVGKNVVDLERAGIFKPSVVLKVLQMKKQLTLQQETRTGKIILTTATPIFDEQGTITKVICNSRDVTELLTLKGQLKENEEKVKRYESELLQLKNKVRSLKGFVANSKTMERVVSMLRRISAVQSTVLITGESGTGKEVIAKEIHNLSPKNEGPFIKINCGAIPESLLESELFGYETGAFSGAKKGGKPGYFELADKGTLFLDEIGELPFSLQAKLLQAIQDKSVQRIGDTKSIPIDFRLIAATNQNLNEMIANGKFREDLFYRLNVIPIELPPLRERIEDIPYLVRYFLDKFNILYNFQKPWTLR
jgi:PAS domain S-box-containing protein